MRIKRVVSGGQTGVDRAALDWAIAHHIPHGGWCPAGRLAEDGCIPDQYQLDELANAGYRDRTRANVRDSDATLIIALHRELNGGTLLTAQAARAFGRPCLAIYPQLDWQQLLLQWRPAPGEITLNVAGPRASKAPEIASFVHRVLDVLIVEPHG